MRATLSNFLRLLKQHFNRFDSESVELKQNCLKVAKTKAFRPGKDLLIYHDYLLFILAHPSQETIAELAEKELARITAVLKKKKLDKTKLENTGLPFTDIFTSFSHDSIIWMMNQGYSVSGEPDSESGFTQALRLSLPSAERELATYGYSYEDFLDALKLKKKDVLKFLILQLSSLNASPLLKDYLFELTETYVRVQHNSADFSRSYNRFLKAPVFYHRELVKRFDHLALINNTLPDPTPLSEQEEEKLMAVIKNSMILTARETDPATYLQTDSLRYYELERGIAVAIYGMTGDRQLPFESYVGYTLFKNGFPAAYGGAWVFGKRSLFGMNIFEAFRGGESGYMMCQLLRVYRQVFRVGSIEVEPYQFGKDNPDGIRSGAFWFYYRYGFRPIDKQLSKLALTESKKIASQKGYQSSYKTLERFTDSFIALDFERVTQPKVTDVTTKITSHIAKTYKGNRLEAERVSLEKLGFANHSKAAREYALFADTLQVQDHAKLKLIEELIAAKPKDLYGYQDLVLQFFR